MMRFDFLHDPRPAFVGRAVSLRLPKEIYVQTIVAAAIAFAIAATCAVEGLRLHAARALESRVRRHFEATRDALSAVRLEWRELDALALRDRRLREIRLSGSAVAVRIARVGNAFPRRAWATSLTASASGYAVKARGEDLPAVSAVLENLIGGVPAARDAEFRMTRDAGSTAGVLAFDVRSGGTR